jgi:tyrosinase
MLSFLEPKTSYFHVEECDHEEELKLGSDSQPRSNNMIIKASFKSMLFVMLLLLSSIASTWVLFFSVKHDVQRISQQNFTPLSSAGPAWTCQRPTVRREWRVLSEPEQFEYLTAVKCLANKPSKLRNTGSLYDDFAWIHKYLTTSSK